MMVPYAAAAKEHRAKVVNALKGESGVIYLHGGPLTTRKWTDTEEHFRQESNFYYLTGVNEPDCHLLISLTTSQSCLLVPRHSEGHALWCGQPPSCEEMRAQYGFDRCEYADQLGALLKEYAAEKVHVIDGSDLSALHKAGSGVTVVDSHLRSAIAEARVFKTKGEIEVIRMAAKITGEAHIALMKSLKTGVTTETEMHARFVYECARKGAQFQAYTPIVAGAKRGAVLHYVKNNEPLPTNPHDFVLVDAGCEYNLYAGDVTRTYPVGGKFVDEWKTTYEIVLDAQKAVLNALKPGVEWEDMHRLATRVICEGLQKAGILRGSTEELLKHHLPALFFPHGLGHLIGIDVHDVGGYPAGVERIQEPGIRYLRMRRTLKPGMYVTVEPGVYFVDTILEPALKDPNTSKYIDLPTLERFRSKVGGVRIEDDVLITESGIENMTGWIPKEIPDIERVMNE